MLMTLSTIPTTYIINVHAPTAKATEDKKDLLYAELLELMEEIHHKDNIIILLGDFNARVYTIEGPAAAAVFGRYYFNRGAEEGQEQATLQNASMGVNDNRARLLEIATNHNMVTMNTQFQVPNHQRITYRCLGTKWWHPVIGDKYEQMEFLLVGKRWNICSNGVYPYLKKTCTRITTQS